MSKAGRRQQFRVIAFDAVGTLIFPQPPVAKVYHEVACRFGSGRTEDEIAARFRLAFERSEENDIGLEGRSDLATSEAREVRRWREIVSEVIDDVADSEGCFRALYAHFAEPGAWRCYDDVGPALERLADDGYRLLIASNFDERLERVRAGLKELQPIERCVISATIGWRKPSGEFYRALFQAAACRPEELLMVGDDFENDVCGARTAGAAAVLLDRRGPARFATIPDLSRLPDLLDS